MKKIYLSASLFLLSIWSIAQCTVSLTFTIDGNTVTASVTGTGANSPSYAIEWGDGTQDLVSSATHTYADGNYNICGAMFDMNNPLGCAVMDCYDIVIGQGGGTGCTVSFTPLVSGLNVGINAAGNGAATPVYTITWGDGSPEEFTATGYHTYAAPGDYTICVLYADDVEGGCIIENCQTVTVAELQTDCTLTIDVTSDPSTGQASVVATGSGAANPQYVIAWGDGGFPSVGATGDYTYAANGSYNLCVTLVDVDNPLTCNVTSCATVDVTIGVVEAMQWNPQIGVFPNPAENVIFVQWQGARANDLVIEILDLNGRAIEQVRIGAVGVDQRQWPIDVSQLSTGVYVLRAKSSIGQKSIRFTK